MKEGASEREVDSCHARHATEREKGRSVDRRES